MILLFLAPLAHALDHGDLVHRVQPLGPPDNRPVLGYTPEDGDALVWLDTWLLPVRLELPGGATWTGTIELSVHDLAWAEVQGDRPFCLAPWALNVDRLPDGRWVYDVTGGPPDLYRRDLVDCGG